MPAYGFGAEQHGASARPSWRHGARTAVVMLKLPHHQRARLARELIGSLDEDAEMDQAWYDEVERRLLELEETAAFYEGGPTGGASKLRGAPTLVP